MSARKSIRTSRFVEILESRVHLSLAGDANSDGVVDSNDFTAVALHYNGPASGIVEGDFNADATCNSLDFSILAYNFGRVEVATKHWEGLNGDGVSLSDGANYVEATSPNNSTDIISIINAGIAPGSLGTLTTCGGLILDDSSNSTDYSFLAGLTVNGDDTISNTAGISLAASNGNLVTANNTGAITVGSFTGTGKTISCSAGTLNLASKAIPATYLVSSSGGALISHYTQDVSAGTNSQFSSLGGSVAAGSTLHFGITAARWASLDVPVFHDDSTGDLAISWSGGTASVAIPSDATGTLHPTLVDQSGTTTITLADITVAAPSTAVPRNKINTGVGISL